ncbi:MAG TPA: ABC transporter permease subunit, partial [Methanomassiliicoccales archaeon]|nr:ABC transporter permease subunit [Methanomassiliicoccales archaeon]
IPSVVLGFLGMVAVAPLVRETLNVPTGLTAFTGSLMLAYMALPTIISVAEDAIDAVPKDYRDGALALGATHWQTVKKVVLPTAMPGILTGVILNVGRVAGETAPILFTAATFYTRGYPDSIFSEVMALPYHIYALMTEGTRPEAQTAIAYGCALILLCLVLAISGLAIVLRQRQRTTYGS